MCRTSRPPTKAAFKADWARRHRDCEKRLKIGRASVYRVVGFLTANRERCDKALIVPNLYVETTCQLHCLHDGLFIVGALHNFGSPQKMTTASDGVGAI